jgi:hypothetical protein
MYIYVYMYIGTIEQIESLLLSPLSVLAIKVLDVFAYTELMALLPWDRYSWIFGYVYTNTCVYEYVYIYIIHMYIYRYLPVCLSLPSLFVNCANKYDCIRLYIGGKAFLLRSSAPSFPMDLP